VGKRNALPDITALMGLELIGRCLLRPSREAPSVQLPDFSPSIS
jgi:hypothetical protein